MHVQIVVHAFKWQGREGETQLMTPEPKKRKVVKKNKILVEMLVQTFIYISGP